MNLLLDTHVLIWCFENNKHLKESVRELLADSDNNIFVSAVSTWELSMKAALGKITMPEDFEVQRERSNFKPLPISIQHTLVVKELPDHHRDPFDRLLIAQALSESLTLVTHDPAIWSYPAPLLKA
jgi:PIN domain nuclease of toxin-antitoxin system